MKNYRKRDNYYVTLAARFRSRPPNIIRRNVSSSTTAQDGGEQVFAFPSSLYFRSFPKAESRDI